MISFASHHNATWGDLLKIRNLFDHSWLTFDPFMQSDISASLLHLEMIIQWRRHRQTQISIHVIRYFGLFIAPEDNNSMAADKLEFKFDNTDAFTVSLPICLCRRIRLLTM
jgi:hypothetical protein